MIICFDIGGSAIKGALATSPTTLVPLGDRPTPPNDFDAFLTVIADMVAAAPAPKDASVAIAITGVVDPDSGRIQCANIPCVDGRHLAAEITARLARPVHIANDADCFALAPAGHDLLRQRTLGPAPGDVIRARRGVPLVADGGAASDRLPPCACRSGDDRRQRASNESGDQVPGRAIGLPRRATFRPCSVGSRSARRSPGRNVFAGLLTGKPTLIHHTDASRSCAGHRA